MADVVITLNIMPESPDVDLGKVQEKSLALIKEFTGNENTKVEVIPMSFGLKSVKIMLVSDEANGSTDTLEASIEEIEGVNSVEVTDVRRTIG